MAERRKTLATVKNEIRSLIESSGENQYRALPIINFLDVLVFFMQFCGHVLMVFISFQIN